MKHTKLRWDHTELSLSLSLGTKLEECPIMRLTEELIREILLRMSAKTLNNCALVCKKFESIIIDRKFPIAHLEFSKQINEPITIVLQTNNVISRVEFNDNKDISKGVRLVKFEHQLPEIMLDDYYCYMIGSCNGLVCMYLVPEFGFEENLMFILNPVTEECELIALPGENGSVFLNVDSCWFGYVPSVDDYKVFLSYSVQTKRNIGFRMCLYSFKKSKWRKFRVKGEVPNCFVGSDCVYVNEALHCVGVGGSICKFDLVKETFEKVPVSVGDPAFLKHRPDVSLGVVGKEGCLCVVFVRFHSVVENRDSEGEDEVRVEQEEERNEDPEEKEKLTIEVWILQEYGNLNSWKKWCGIELKGAIFRNSMNFLGFAYGDFLCFQGKDGLVIVDPMHDPPSYAIAPNDAKEKVRKMSNFFESIMAPVYLIRKPLSIKNILKIYEASLL